MRLYSLNLSVHTISDFFEEMLEGRHDNEKNDFLKTRLLSVKQNLIDAEIKYKKLGSEGRLFEISEQDFINIPLSEKFTKEIPQSITISEMKKVYTNYFVGEPGSSKVGRKVYDDIMSNADNNLCPYCSDRRVRTVDHFLPKSRFILFTVAPVNLLPCCSDCNKDKSDAIELSEDKILIHPYFDDLSKVSWLDCKVVQGTFPITFSYRVSENISDPKLKSRIDNQFTLLNLNELYADNAARAFNGRVKTLVNWYNSNPKRNALDFIQDSLESFYAENRNSWQTKMYEALKQSEWFLEEALPQLQEHYQTYF